jgi:hypothetical protein
MTSGCNVLYFLQRINTDIKLWPKSPCLEIFVSKIQCDFIYKVFTLLLVELFL